MELYDRLVLPHFIDCLCGMKAIQRERAAVVPRAHGEVLEIGIGTGRNLPFYDASKVTSIAGLDPADQMSPKARERAKASGLNVNLLTLSAEDIPADDASYDCIVCTFTLCSIPEPVKALHEMRRVLRPGGELFFCEHGLAPEAGIAKWQSRLTPYWMPIAGGCNLDRDVLSMLDQGGFEVKDVHQDYVKGPKPLTYVTRGMAVAA